MNKRPKSNTSAMGETKRRPSISLNQTLVTHSLVTQALSVSCVAMLIGCGTAPVPQDPLLYLRVGVDIDEEAQEVSKLLDKRGLTTETYRRPRYAVVTGRRNDEHVIRIITKRGTVLAAASPDTHGREALSFHSRESLKLALADDLLHHLVLSAFDPAIDRTCFAIMAVSEEGALQEVAMVDEAIDDSACIESFENVQGDAHVEALVGLRVPIAGLILTATQVYGGRDWKRLSSRSATALVPSELSSGKKELHQCGQEALLRFLRDGRDAAQKGFKSCFKAISCGEPECEPAALKVQKMESLIESGFLVQD